MVSKLTCINTPFTLYFRTVCVSTVHLVVVVHFGMVQLRCGLRDVIDTFTDDHSHSHAGA